MALFRLLPGGSRICSAISLTILGGPHDLPTSSVHCACYWPMAAPETRRLRYLRQPLLYSIAKQQCSPASKGGSGCRTERLCRTKRSFKRWGVNRPPCALSGHSTAGIVSRKLAAIQVRPHGPRYPTFLWSRTYNNLLRQQPSSIKACVLHGF